MPCRCLIYTGKVYTDTAGGGQLLDWNYRPLDELRNADNVIKLNDYRINLTIHYGIFRGLDAFAYYQYGKGVSDQQNFQSQQTFYTRNLINEYTQLNGGMPVRPSAIRRYPGRDR